MKRKLLSLLLAAGILGSIIAGCASSSTPAPSPSSAPVTSSTPAPAETPDAGPRIITDMAGREVELPEEINTIATFGAVGVLNAFVELMGCGNKICNQMPPSFTKNDKWAMQYKFAPQIADGPVFENADRELLIEEVLNAKPDLCVTMTKSTAEELAAKGLCAVYLAWSEVDDIKAAVELMGEILGKEDIAGVTAIRNDAIYYVPTVAHVWGNRTVEQPLTILWTLNKLYPELYSTEELSQDIHDFYEHYFLYDMSDEEIAGIIG